MTDKERIALMVAYLQKVDTIKTLVKGVVDMGPFGAGMLPNVVDKWDFLEKQFLLNNGPLPELE